MPNIAGLLRDEIVRLARREMRAQTEAMKKASAQHRRDIAALKRDVAALSRQVALLGRKTSAETPAQRVDDSAGKLRFSAKRLKAHRERLELSAANYAKLAGVAPQSIYNWERGTARPRKEQLAALAALRTVSRKQARDRLQELDG